MTKTLLENNRDHGGGLDRAIARFGGSRIGWIDLSTGINPHPYPIAQLPADAWTALPDKAAYADLTNAARAFWSIPDAAGLIAASGASALIAQIPGLLPPGRVSIPGPTYNEHAAAFRAAGWYTAEALPPDAQVVVHPNNPDGRIWSKEYLTDQNAKLTIIDESFCDVAPAHSLIEMTQNPRTLILKSFGKFWGWAVSGPALHIGATALADTGWARASRLRLAEDSMRLDALMQIAGAKVIGGTSLFRLYDVGDANLWQNRLAKLHIWSRTFPYEPRWLRLGLPHTLQWPRVEEALK